MSFRFDTLPRWLRDMLPLLFWMALIFFLSSRPTLIEIESDVEDKIFYKTAHFLAYAGLAWLWWRALTPHRRLLWSTLLAAFVLTTLYGVSDEFHQLFVPGRHGRLADVFFDASGALAMLLLLRRIKWLRAFPEVLTLSAVVVTKSGEHSKFSEVNE